MVDNSVNVRKQNGFRSQQLKQHYFISIPDGSAAENSPEHIVLELLAEQVRVSALSGHFCVYLKFVPCARRV